MVIKQADRDVYWNYFLAIEEDLLRLSRYVEFSKQNRNVYSLEMARLLLAISSEVDVVAKELSKSINPSRPANNINDYRRVVMQAEPAFATSTAYMRRFGMTFRPWVNWKNEESPLWWKSYNEVKHHRSEHFERATLTHVLNAFAGLFLLIIYRSRAVGLRELRPAPQLITAQGSLATIDSYPDGSTLMFTRD